MFKDGNGNSLAAPHDVAIPIPGTDRAGSCSVREDAFCIHFADPVAPEVRHHDNAGFLQDVQGPGQSEAKVNGFDTPLRYSVP